MKKEEPIQYTIEREFLSKISIDELLVRIIQSHLKGNEYDRYEESEPV